MKLKMYVVIQTGKNLEKNDKKCFFDDGTVLRNTLLFSYENYTFSL